MLCKPACPCNAPAKATQPSFPMSHPGNKPQSAHHQHKSRHTRSQRPPSPLHTPHCTTKMSHAPERLMLCNEECPCSAPAKATQPSPPMSHPANTLTFITPCNQPHTPHFSFNNTTEISHVHERLMLCKPECPCSAPAKATQPALPMSHPENKPQSAKHKHK